MSTAKCRPSLTSMQRVVARWNDAHPVGCTVRYWPGLREGEDKKGVTWSEAIVLGGHTPCVFVSGVGAVALTHVEVLSDCDSEAAGDGR